MWKSSILACSRPSDKFFACSTPLALDYPRAWNRVVQYFNTNSYNYFNISASAIQVTNNREFPSMTFNMQPFPPFSISSFLWTLSLSHLYLLIFVIREKWNWISVVHNSLFFSSVNRVRPPRTPHPAPRTILLLIGRPRILIVKLKYL